MTPIFRNMTPHAVTLRNPKGEDTILAPYAPKGQEARVANAPGEALAEQPFPDVVMVHAPDVVGEVVGLPDPEPGVVYIVSALVGEALTKSANRIGYRADVVTLGTGPQDGAIREPAKLPDGAPNPRGGQIVAVTRLKMLAP